MSDSLRAEDLLADRIEIRSGKMLLEVAESLREFIQKGLLKQVGGSTRIEDLREGSPWPDDIIEQEFETIPGGARYRLSCETYHGRGGIWERVKT